MSDLISKKELYHKISEAYSKGHLSWGANEVIKDIIGECDPVEKKGEWIDSDIPNEKYVCSNCGGACWYYDYEGEVAKSNFCPNCGADMRGDNNG